MKKMTDTEKMVALMRAMKRRMNGAVAEAMERRGIRYPANWGVAVPDIRKAAAAFAPDHSFARFLWKQQLRELRLAALTIADPAAVDAEELDFWGDGAVNPELAENLAFSLLSRTVLDRAIVERWGRNDVPPLLNYCMLLTLTRMLRAARTAEGLAGDAATGQTGGLTGGADAELTGDATARLAGGCAGKATSGLTGNTAAPGPETSTAYDALRRRSGEAAARLLSSADRLVAEAADNLLLSIEEA